MNLPRFKDGELVNKFELLHEGSAFAWNDALLIPSWGIYHIPSDEELKNIIELSNRFSPIVKKLGGIKVSCWIRPTFVNNPEFKEFHGRNYNKFVGSVSLASLHISGRAIDFKPLSGSLTDYWNKTRELWLGRMEVKEATIKSGSKTSNGKETGWIHIDDKDYGKPYTFKP